MIAANPIEPSTGTATGIGSPNIIVAALITGTTRSPRMPEISLEP